MKCVVLAGSAVRMATSGVETQRAAWNADVNSSIDRIMFVLLSDGLSRRKVARQTAQIRSAAGAALVFR